jgi:hypothetical protein
MLQLQLFDTYSNLFSSMEQQLHKGQIPLMLFKNITKKRDVREWIFQTTQATFVTEFRADIVEDLKKIVICKTIVCIHPQNHPHFAFKNSLEQIYAVCFICKFIFLRGGGGAVVYYIVQCINSYAHIAKLKVF